MLQRVRRDSLSPWERAGVRGCGVDSMPPCSRFVQENELATFANGGTDERANTNRAGAASRRSAAGACDLRGRCARCFPDPDRAVDPARGGAFARARREGQDRAGVRIGACGGARAHFANGRDRGASPGGNLARRQRPARPRVAASRRLRGGCGPAHLRLAHPNDGDRGCAPGRACAHRGREARTREPASRRERGGDEPADCGAARADGRRRRRCARRSSPAP